MRYQVVEKTVGSAWSQVRYQDFAVKNFDTEEQAVSAAVEYLNEVNLNNPLAADEKMKVAEAFMLTDEGAFFGVLDGKKLIMKDRHGNPVTDRDYYELSGKTEVSVMPIPGS